MAIHLHNRPLPKRLGSRNTRGPGRQRKENKYYKAEWCRSLNNCPYGASCKYAHNKEELRQLSISDVKPTYQGVECFRAKPCFDFVATGKCPMNGRCPCLHDPKLKILPAMERDLVTINIVEYPEADVGSDIHVDRLYKTRISGGPMGSQTELMLKDLDTLTRAVCNDTREYESSSESSLTKIQLLKIALEFAKTRGNQLFTYRDTHIVYSSHSCMILQEKRFDISNGDAKEVPFYYSCSEEDDKKLISVHEIAFDQEVSHRTNKNGNLSAPALWFNIPEFAVRRSDAGDIKKLKNQLKDDEEQRTVFKDCHFDVNEPPFFVFYPARSSLRDLITDIYLQEISALIEKASDSSRRLLCDISRARHTDTNMMNLEERFLSIRRELKADEWPVSKNRKNQKLDDPAPTAEDEYIIPEEGFTFHKHLWDTFKNHLSSCAEVSSDDAVNSSMCAGVARQITKNRLPILVALAKEENAKTFQIEDPSMPAIITRFFDQERFLHLYNEWWQKVIHPYNARSKRRRGQNHGKKTKVRTM